MPKRTLGRKRATPRKLTEEQKSSAPSAPPAATQAETPRKIGDMFARSNLEKGIAELQGLHDLLLSNEVDPDVLADFRDALNRLRNTAWAAHQYIVRKETDQDPTSVLSLLAGERIRAAYQLCQALADDLKRTDIQFQRGSLVELHEVTQVLAERLHNIIDRLG